MKTCRYLKRGAKSTLACAALGFALHAGTASAQTLTLISPTVNDGGFESVTSGTGVLFTSTVSAASAVPYWGVTGTPITNSGAQMQGAGGNTVQAGVSGSYYKFTDSPVFNLAGTYMIKAGDQFTLSWYARSSGATLSSQTVTLFSQATPAANASYTYSGTPLTTASGAAYALTTGFTQYTLTYTAAAADVGKSIGLTFANSGAGGGSTDTANTFVTADSFSLNVASVPEARSSTYAVICAGIGGLSALRRRLLARV